MPDEVTMHMQTLGKRRPGRRGAVALAVAALLPLVTAGCRTVVLAERPAQPGRLLAEIERELRPGALPAALTLADAKAVTLRQNPTLAAARARVAQAEARVRQAQAAYLPRLTATGGYQRTEYRPLSLGGLATDPEERYTVSLDAQWLVFNGLSREFGELAARYGAQAAEHGRAEAQRLLLKGVAAAYCAALLQEHLMATSEADAAFNKQLLDETLARRQEGAASRVDELNFRIAHNRARLAYLDARHNWRAARTALAELLGLPTGELPDATKLVEPEPPPPDAVNLDDAVATLLRRPDLKVLASAVEAARAQVKARWGDLYPVLAANGQFGATRLDDPGFGADDRLYGYGASASWELDFGGQRRHAYREAQGQWREAEAELIRARNAAMSELRRDADALDTARDALALQAETAKLSREQRELEEQRWRAGQSSLTRLNEVQTTLVRAEAFWASSRLQLVLAVENLTATLGCEPALAPTAEVPQPKERQPDGKD